MQRPASKRHSKLHKRRSAKAKGRRQRFHGSYNPGTVVIPASVRKLDVDKLYDQGKIRNPYSNVSLQNKLTALEILKPYLSIPKIPAKAYTSAIETIDVAVKSLAPDSMLSHITFIEHEDEDAVLYYTPVAPPENGFICLRYLFRESLAYKYDFMLALVKAWDTLGFGCFGWQHEDSVNNWFDNECEEDDEPADKIKESLQKLMRHYNKDVRVTMAIEKLAKERGNLDNLLLFPPCTEEGIIGRIVWLAVKLDYMKRVEPYRDIFGTVENWDSSYFTYWDGHAYYYDLKAADIYEKIIAYDYDNYGSLTNFFEYHIYKKNGSIVTNSHEPFINILAAITTYDLRYGIYTNNYVDDRKYAIDTPQAKTRKIDICNELVEAFLYLDDLLRAGGNYTLRGSRRSYLQWKADKQKSPFAKATKPVRKPHQAGGGNDAKRVFANGAFLYQHDSVQHDANVVQRADTPLPVLQDGEHTGWGVPDTRTGVDRSKRLLDIICLQDVEGEGYNALQSAVSEHAA
jgi:hypothetical protein